MSRPIIEADRVSKVYRLGTIGATSLKEECARIWGLVRGRVGSAPKADFWALRDVSFTVNRGEVLGIIGRNGAGKSTLLKILSRITQQTSGEITLRGRVASLLEVGTGFHPDLTGRENIFLNGAILGMTKAEIRGKLDEIIAFAEIERFIDTPVKRYSSGMYVRLAFAVAAHLESEILIVDEVLAVGDLSFQKKCLGKMGEVSSRTGTTVLFVSHNMSAVRRLCSRVVLLKDGQTEYTGPAEAVIAQYLSLNSAAIASATELPPGDPDSAARGTSLNTMTLDGRPEAQFRLGEPWKIRLEFTLRKPLSHVIAAVGVRNVEAVPLVTWWSAPADLAVGNHAVEFVCDVPFSACEISFNVGISAYESSLYYEEGVGRAAISEISLGEQPMRAKDCGIIATSVRPEIHRA